MDNARQQIVDSIKKGTNILVAVSSDPSVDELSAALGLSIILNNMDKRATAVFSGAIPPAIEFLEPGKTFENSADSLRDFIIALNKEKADHLRYKVEGDVVKIFITPYKTKLSQDDLEFSQGDYNVDMVLALGVKDQEHLDKALEAHGKILHDATVATITVGGEESKLGSVDWHDTTASSLSEMVVSLGDSLKGEGPILNEQIATALLTGIVSATARFSNDHTTSRSMTMAAQLMAAGANQQLIAAKLEEGHDLAPVSSAKSEKISDKQDSEGDSGLTIERDEKKEESEKPAEDKSEEKPVEQPKEEPQEEKPVEEKPESRDNSAEKSNEEVAQEELEKNLAGLTAAPAETQTLEDIENELKHATEELTEVTDTPPVIEDVKTAPVEEPVVEPVPAEPVAAPVITPEPVIPSVEPVAPVEPAPAPEVIPEPDLSLPPMPELPPLEPAPAPEIVNEHGTFTGAPSTDGIPPINSIQTSPLEGEPAAVDPFAQTAATQQVAPVEPSTNQGTPEGAAILASGPAPAPQPAPVTIPELPPLPPLPTDVSLPPLPPPPPPPPVLGQAPTGLGEMPSGAVSGDVFGDGTAPADTAAPAPAAPPEPGQYKIPGS